VPTRIHQHRVSTPARVLTAPRSVRAPTSLYGQHAQCSSTSASNPSHRQTEVPPIALAHCEDLSMEGHRAQAEAIARRASALASGSARQGDPQRGHAPLDFTLPTQPSQQTCIPAVRHQHRAEHFKLDLVGRSQGHSAGCARMQHIYTSLRGCTNKAGSWLLSGPEVHRLELRRLIKYNISPVVQVRFVDNTGVKGRPIDK